MQSTLYKRSAAGHNKRNWIIIAVLITVLAATAAILWFSMNDGSKLNTDGAVFVKNIERSIPIWQKVL